MPMIPIGTDLRATVKYLKAHALVVVTAESCTAGLIASRLAAAPGAGEVLECAFVVYDPKAKRPLTPLVSTADDGADHLQVAECRMVHAPQRIRPRPTRRCDRPS